MHVLRWWLLCHFLEHVVALRFVQKDVSKHTAEQVEKWRRQGVRFDTIELLNTHMEAGRMTTWVDQEDTEDIWIVNLQLDCPDSAEQVAEWVDLTISDSGSRRSSRGRPRDSDEFGVFRVLNHSFVVKCSAKAVADILEHECVESVQQDSVVEEDEIHEDTETFLDDVPWGLDAVDGSEDGQYTHQKTGAGVRIFVLDTAILSSHQEFGSPTRVLAGADFAGSTCGEEEEETCATPGAQGCQCGLLQPGDSCIGHGTGVAGIVAGASVGVAKDATVVAVAVMDCDGKGYESDVLAGMNFVTDVKRGEPDVRTVMLMSVGAPRPIASYRDPAKDPKFIAVQAASELDVVVVVAAGYEGSDVRYKTPAHLSTVVTVCGINAKQKLTDSNYGRNVDVCAPGHKITSASTGDSPVDATYSTSSGTSFAAPFVAGALALLLQDNDWTFEQQVGELLTHCVLTDVVDMKELPTQVVPNRLLNLGSAQCAAMVAGQDADPESPPEPIVEKSDSWILHEGTCLLRGACITSPNFPRHYARYEFCNFTHQGSRVRVTSFDVETGYDILTAHGVQWATQRRCCC